MNVFMLLMLHWCILLLILSFTDIENFGILFYILPFFTFTGELINTSSLSFTLKWTNENL